MQMPPLFERYFQQWLDRRIPAQQQLELNQRRIFIFPSRQGFYFLIVLLLILIAAINYQNNLAYALCFLLASIFNTSILMTYMNVSGLRLQAGRSVSVFAGESAEFELELSRHAHKQHHRIELGFPGNASQQHDLIKLDRKLIKLHCVTSERGRFKPGRIKLECYYPLGFIRCWSWIDLDLAVVVYPKPVALRQLPMADLDGGGQGSRQHSSGRDDFFGFRDYVPGDSQRLIDWRSLAKGQPLQSKVYSSQQQQRRWVDWEALPGVNTEERLSLLCDWVLQLDARQQLYGLRIPGVEIAPGTGEKHKHQVLTALALYGEPER